MNIKKGLMDRYRFRCNYCGNEHYKLLWLLKLRLIFTDKLYFTCPKCHKTNCYVQIFHLRHDSTDTLEKGRNKQKLWDERLK